MSGEEVDEKVADADGDRSAVGAVVFETMILQDETVIPVKREANDSK